MLRRSLQRVAIAALLAAMAMPALAQTPIKIGIGFGIGFLPMFIADEMNLVEKHGRDAGIDLRASYQRFSGSSAMQDALLSGAVDMGVYGVPALLIVWDKAHGSSQQVIGVAGVNASPLVLVTSKPNAKSLADLEPADRIAMPALVSPQMYVLQMLSEKAFGAGQQDRLKNQVVALPHPESVNAILSGGTEVKAYFSTPPFTQIALDSGKAHRLASSEDAFGGRSSFLVLGATKRFLDANPKVADVMIKALDEAAELIRKDPRRAAEIYMKVEPSKLLDVDKVEAMLKTMPGDFGVAVHGVKAYADYMARRGGLKNVPATWRDVFPLIGATSSN
jgi:NitT/TauT family transport system substrate-binding protein